MATGHWTERVVVLALGLGIALAAPAAEVGPTSAPAQFTPLVPLPAPHIVASSTAFPGGAYNVQNILDGKPLTEYASHDKGVGTFIDFDLGTPVQVAAFEHVNRNDVATVAASKLLFSDSPDFRATTAAVEVRHAAAPAGRTFWTMPSPVTARYVRWQVTVLGTVGASCAGGSEIRFYSALAPEPTPTRDTVELIGFPAVVLQDGRPARKVQIRITHPYAEPDCATLHVTGQAALPVLLEPGSQSIEVSLPAAEKEAVVQVAMQIGGKTVLQREVTLKPVRPWVIYLLPHSHVDIGYTQVQTEVEKLHWKYLDDAQEIIRRTSGHPPEAQFKWNTEVLWQVDSYLRQATPEKRQGFLDAVRAGRLHLDALYGNELTGLCRPEELFRLLDCARRLSQQYGVTIDSAMISDVPGYTWGIVPALAQSGVRYFSIGLNHVHRIGRTILEHGDRPFYWVSPSGHEKVLCWVAGKGYSWFHINGRIRKVPPQKFFEYLAELEATGFPYDMLMLRYCVNGDNGPPDPELPDFVREWNARHVSPRMVITTTGEMFREFERRYGDRIPQVRGDFTPHWEDGAGSSSRETSMTRTASERLVQAEALWAILKPQAFPADAFRAAWRNVLLYNEHTWGAHCSITQPDSEFTKAQWRIKQAFAVDADAQSRKLLTAAVASRASEPTPVQAFDVFNAASWPRTDLVVLPAGLMLAGDVVREAEDGRPVQSQRLSTGSLAFLASDVPPFGAKRFLVQAGNARATGAAKAEGATLRNGRVALSLNSQDGSIASLTCDGLPVDLVRREAGLGLAGYVYVTGRNPQNQQRGGKAAIRVREPGPLVAVLSAESDAPGCRKLAREFCVVDGLDRVDITCTLDKQPVRSQESVHFGFALNVPDGTMRMDVPWAIIRPEADQLSGACRNYFSVGRWMDVSNEQFGVTWATLDAPLVEVGAIRVDVPSPFDPEVWVRKLDPTQTFYSYAMNNYWETNYKADQEGPTVFRYSLVPHGRFDAGAAARFGIERSQPLVAAPVARASSTLPPRLRVEPADVLVTSLKPTEDGKALILRLWNAADRPRRATLAWSAPAPQSVTRSSPREDAGPAVTDGIDLAPLGIVTLRAELAE